MKQQQQNRPSTTTKIEKSPKNFAHNLILQKHIKLKSSQNLTLESKKLILSPSIKNSKTPSKTINEQFAHAFALQKQNSLLKGNNINNLHIDQQDKLQSSSPVFQENKNIVFGKEENKIFTGKIRMNQIQNQQKIDFEDKNQLLKNYINCIHQNEKAYQLQTHTPFKSKNLYHSDALSSFHITPKELNKIWFSQYQQNQKEKPKEFNLDNYGQIHNYFSQIVKSQVQNQQISLKENSKVSSLIQEKIRQTNTENEFKEFNLVQIDQLREFLLFFLKFNHNSKSIVNSKEELISFIQKISHFQNLMTQQLVTSDQIELALLNDLITKIIMINMDDIISHCFKQKKN